MPVESARKTSSVDEAPSVVARSTEQPHFNHLKPQVVRIEVLGDEKVGKTSLICSLVSRHYSEKVPSVLLNVQIPAEESDENVVISITDTSCTWSLRRMQLMDLLMRMCLLNSAGIRSRAHRQRHQAQRCDPASVRPDAARDVPALGPLARIHRQAQRGLGRARGQQSGCHWRHLPR